MRHLLVIGFLLSGCATATAAEAKGKSQAPLGPITVEVDLSEAPQRLLHAKLTLPVKAGPLTLVYPKWIPGEHGPTGPVVDVTGLVISANGQPLAWRRDDVEMYAIDLVVPAGVKELSVALEVVTPAPAQEGYSSGSSASELLAVMSWNQVVFLPAGYTAKDLRVRPSLTLPGGWGFATSLEVAKKEAARVEFAETSLELLVDSPVLAGRYLVESPLGALDGAPVSIAVAAESAGEAHLTDEHKAWLKNLVAEEQALFGRRHFDHYTFLLTLSDAVTHFGLEHHQSSDNRLAGRTLVDRDVTVSDLVSLLAHESVHSWNGKHRRPAGLATADYQAPMKGELLWIYEGLTQYLGIILTSRAGAWTPEQARGYWADTAEGMRLSRGRNWRPLEDTAVMAQTLYGARGDGQARRRSVDFYAEGQLLWLEADATIREKTAGKASLDDFVRKFHGGALSGAPSVLPYTLDDVIKTLNEVAPHDWKTFFETRVRRTSDDAPLAGLAMGGWRLGYGAEPGEFFKTQEKLGERTDLRSSLGFILSADKHALKDVVPGSPADRAGLAGGMSVLAINGRKFTPERLTQAIIESKSAGKVELTVENGDVLRTVALEYREGPKFARLERIEGKPDVLGEILKAKAAK